MPGKDFMAAYAADPENTTGRASRRATKRFDIGDGVGGNLTSTFMGAMTNIPFLDELMALRGGMVGGSYSDNLELSRDFVEEAEEANPNFFLGGQIAGAFVPMGGAAKAATGLTFAQKAARAAGVGAVYGSVYGLGEGEDLDERLEMAGTGALVGGVGGWLIGGVAAPLAERGLNALSTRLKIGRSPRLDPADLPANPIKFADDVTTAAPRKNPKSLLDPDGHNGLAKATPSVLDELEDGALFTVRELLGDPGAAAAAVAKRLGKLTPDAAEGILKAFVKSEADGSALTNVHFRSLLKLDMTDMKLTPEQIARAAEVFEDGIEALAEKAGQKTRTVKGMEQEVAAEIRKGITLDRLKDAYENGQNGFKEARIAQFTLFTAAAKVVRLREELLPELLKGTEGAREKLAEELTDAAHRMVYAKGIMSNAGRTLGILSHGTKARLVDVAEDAYALDAAQVAERVKGALGQLKDDDLKDLLSRVRTMADAEALERVLLDEGEAAAFSWGRRALGSVALFMRSNALTPATFFFNMSSYVLTAGFRGQWSKSLAASRLERAGKIDEALMLRIETQLTRSVKWQARKAAFSAMGNRIKWEFWDDVEKMFSVLTKGTNRIEAKAQLKRETMLKSGYSPPSLREGRTADTRAARFTFSKEEVNAGLEKNFAGVEPHVGGFASLVTRLGFFGFNALDALGGASMKVFTGAVDDFGRAHTRVSELYAQSARQGFKEARQLVEDGQLSMDDLPKWVDKRARELAEMPTADMMARVERDLATGGELGDEASFFVDLQKAIEKEAEERLYMDGPQSKLGKSSAQFLETIDKLGIIFPYVRTPIRLFERGLVDYGPFAMRSKQNREILEKGGLEAELLKARIDIGLQAFNAGIGLGIVGGITATNGGFDNSANLDAGPPNRLNLPGGGFIEIGRLDPFSLTVGLGAMFGQMMRDGYDAGNEYEKSEVLRAMLATAANASVDVALSKTYLKSLKDLTDALSNSNEEAGLTRAGNILGNAAARLVPLGGVTRQVKETFRTSAVEAVGFSDQLLRTIPFAGWGMAPRVDVLGDEVKSRQLGINFGDSTKTEGEDISPVKAELRRLGIDVNTIRKSDPEGFKLTSEELSEVRKIRGKEATDKFGRTMSEALEELFADPWFQNLPTKDQKRTEVVETMKAFNKPAWEILMERNPGYAAKKTYHSSFVDYMKEGMDEKSADTEAKLDVEFEGLPTNNL